jgi:DnaJ-class molecular chaperone
MSKAQTPFEILGVTPADDMTTIRMAWRAKVRRLHPDVVGNTRAASSRLAEVNAAFDALQGHQPSKRAKAAKAAEEERAAHEAVRMAQEAARQRAELRHQREVAEAERRLAALEHAKAEALKAKLQGHMGTVQATAVNGYAVARKILAA